MRSLCCAAFVVVMLVVAAAGPARAVLFIGGNLVVVPNIVVFEIRPFDPTPALRSTGLVAASLTDGFGTTVGSGGGHASRYWARVSICL